MRVANDLPNVPPSDAPDDLKPLWPLVLEWGLGDDVDRGEIVDVASDGALRALIDAVIPVLPSIDAYLDATSNAERAVPYGDLAQAALEARLELDRRT